MAPVNRSVPVVRIRVSRLGQRDRLDRGTVPPPRRLPWSPWLSCSKRNWRLLPGLRMMLLWRSVVFRMDRSMLSYQCLIRSIWLRFLRIHRHHTRCHLLPLCNRRHYGFRQRLYVWMYLLYRRTLFPPDSTRQARLIPGTPRVPSIRSVLSVP